MQDILYSTQYYMRHGVSTQFMVHGLCGKPAVITKDGLQRYCHD